LVIDDPRDKTAYRTAITMLGLALIVTIIGVCWVAAAHQCPRNIPTEIWFLPAGFGGVFVGLLIPLSFRSKRTDEVVASAVFCGVLAAICVTAILIGHATHHHGRESLAFYAVAVTIGAVLLGLPIPSPGRRDRL
jgi:peptidoglycan/LPS O-acetylase OafA/YrhL